MDHHQELEVVLNVLNPLNIGHRFDLDDLFTRVVVHQDVDVSSEVLGALARVSLRWH